MGRAASELRYFGVAWCTSRCGTSLLWKNGTFAFAASFCLCKNRYKKPKSGLGQKWARGRPPPRPTYPGPGGKMCIFKRNLTLYLAQTKLPKAIYDSVSFASEVLDLPPSYKMRKAKGIETPVWTQKSRRAGIRSGRRIQTAPPRRG